jgi:uncharacterized protein YdhG (YjbR/CyaY superfamily)
MATKPKTAKLTTIDEYLAALGAGQRAALAKLRKTIKAAPQAEELISYGIPAFRQNGMLVGFGATANHCSFFLMSGSTVDAHADELAGYDTSKGTIRFPTAKPLPAALVRKLVKARLAENAGRRGKVTGSRVAIKRRLAKPNLGSSQTNPAVIAFLGKLNHPLKREIEAVRQIILGVSPEIREGIKWNAPSFRTTEYFATLNLRAKDGQDRVWLILHVGAKAKDTRAKGLKIADPAGLLEWLAKDRCLVTFADGKDVQAKRAALQAIVREWIRQL